MPGDRLCDDVHASSTNEWFCNELCGLGYSSSSYKVAKLFHNAAQRSNGKTLEMTSSPQRPSRKPAENVCKVERRGIPSRFYVFHFAVFFVSQFLFASRRLTNDSAFSSWKPRFIFSAKRKNKKSWGWKAHSLKMREEERNEKPSNGFMIYRSRAIACHIIRSIYSCPNRPRR